MVLGAIARGLAGRAARGSGSRMAGRVFKREVLLLNRLWM